MKTKPLYGQCNYGFLGVMWLNVYVNCHKLAKNMTNVFKNKILHLYCQICMHIHCYRNTYEIYSINKTTIIEKAKSRAVVKLCQRFPKQFKLNAKWHFPDSFMYEKHYWEQRYFGVNMTFVCSSLNVLQLL